MNRIPDAITKQVSIDEPAEGGDAVCESRGAASTRFGEVYDQYYCPLDRGLEISEAVWEGTAAGILL